MPPANFTSLTFPSSCWLRHDPVSWIAVVAGRDEGHLTVWIGLRIGLCGANPHRKKLTLTLTLTCTARQCQTRSQKQRKKRKCEAKLFHNFARSK